MVLHCFRSTEQAQKHAFLSISGHLADDFCHMITGEHACQLLGMYSDRIGWCSIACTIHLLSKRRLFPAFAASSLPQRWPRSLITIITSSGVMLLALLPLLVNGGNSLPVTGRHRQSKRQTAAQRLTIRRAQRVISLAKHLSHSLSLTLIGQTATLWPKTRFILSCASWYRRVAVDLSTCAQHNTPRHSPHCVLHFLHTDTVKVIALCPSIHPIHLPIRLVACLLPYHWRLSTVSAKYKERGEDWKVALHTCRFHFHPPETWTSDCSAAIHSISRSCQLSFSAFNSLQDCSVVYKTAVTQGNRDLLLFLSFRCLHQH